MRDNSNRPQASLVRIFGEEYRVSSPDGNPQIQRVAACVDARLRRAARQDPGLPRDAVAVQVAMELAAELLAAQDDREQLLRSAADNLDRLSALIDQRSTLVSLTSDWIRTRGREPEGRLTPGRAALLPRAPDLA